MSRLLAKVLGLPETATDSDLMRALDDLRDARTAPTVTPAAAPDDPQATFERLAEQYSDTYHVSLAEGYSAVSKEAPTLYERARGRATQ